MTIKHLFGKITLDKLNNANVLRKRNISILKSHQHHINVQALSGTYKTCNYFFL